MLTNPPNPIPSTDEASLRYVYLFQPSSLLRRCSIGDLCFPDPHGIIEILPAIRNTNERACFHLVGLPFFQGLNMDSTFRSGGEPSGYFHTEVEW
jgi:hypothetical protein